MIATVLDRPPVDEDTHDVIHIMLPEERKTGLELGTPVTCWCGAKQGYLGPFKPEFGPLMCKDCVEISGADDLI